MAGRRPPYAPEYRRPHWSVVDLVPYRGVAKRGDITGGRGDACVAPAIFLRRRLLELEDEGRAGVDDGHGGLRVGAEVRVPPRGSVRVVDDLVGFGSTLRMTNVAPGGAST